LVEGSVGRTRFETEEQVAKGNQQICHGIRGKHGQTALQHAYYALCSFFVGVGFRVLFFEFLYIFIVDIPNHSIHVIKLETNHVLFYQSPDWNIERPSYAYAMHMTYSDSLKVKIETANSVNKGKKHSPTFYHLFPLISIVLKLNHAQSLPK
jgi:hypothetical protein